MHTMDLFLENRHPPIVATVMKPEHLMDSFSSKDSFRLVLRSGQKQMIDEVFETASKRLIRCRLKECGWDGQGNIPWKSIADLGAVLTITLVEE